MSVPGSRRRRRRLPLVALALALGLGGAEVAWRGALLVRGTPHEAAAVEARIARLANALTDAPPDDVEGRPVPPRPTGDPDYAFLHPYQGYETRRGLAEVAAELAFLEAGGLPEAQRPFVVGVVGGSVALLFAERDRGGVERFTELLAADPRLAGRRIFVLPHGRQAYKEPQQLMLVSYLHTLGLRFDALINLDGFNEVAFGLMNVEYGAHPLYPSFHHAGHLFEAARSGEHAALEARVALEGERTRSLAERLVAWHVPQSAVLSTLGLARLESRRRAWDESRAELRRALATTATSGGERGLPCDPDPDAVLATVVRGWSRASGALRALCESTGTTYLHVLQPTLFDFGSKPLTPEELGYAVPADDTRAAAEGVRLGYPLLRAEGARLAAEGFPFFDASMAFEDVDESLYYDFCHFGNAGNELLAELVARELLARLP